MHSSGSSFMLWEEKAPKETTVKVQLEQQQQPHTSVIIIDNGPHDDVESVPKLEEPECCCGCNIATSSIIMAILSMICLWATYSSHQWCKTIAQGRHEELPDTPFNIAYGIYGTLTLCYIGIAFCRTPQFCYIISAMNHLFSIPIYIITIGCFIVTIQAFTTEDVHGYNKAFRGQFLIGTVFYGFVAYALTYMAQKYQEFGEYLEKEEEQNH